MYVCAQLFELGPEAGDNEIDGELIAETEELPYRCSPRYFNLLCMSIGSVFYVVASHTVRL